MPPWTETYQTKKGPRYIVRWNENGVQKSRRAGTHRRTAKIIEAEIEEGLVLRQNPSLATTTVKICMREYLEVMGKTVRPRTAEIARTSLSPFLGEFGDRKIQTITPQEVEQFKNRLLEFRKVAGINMVIRNLKTFFEFCVRAGYLTANPCKSVSQFKEQDVARFLSREDMATFYKASSPRLRRVIYVLYNTGMRIGEFLNITSDNISEHGVNISGKTGSRHIPLRPMTRKLLLTIVGAWTKDGLESAFRKAVARARMGRIRPHDLRHTWASAYLKSGGTLADLRVLGGWGTLSMVQRYAHFQPHYLAERMIRVRL